MNEYSYKIYPDTKIDRNDMEELTSVIPHSKNNISLNECRNTCDETKGCTAFEYDDDRGCHLFKGKLSTMKHSDTLTYVKQQSSGWVLWILLAFALILFVLIWRQARKNMVRY